MSLNSWPPEARQAGEFSPGSPWGTFWTLLKGYSSQAQGLGEPYPLSTTGTSGSGPTLIPMLSARGRGCWETSGRQSPTCGPAAAFPTPPAVEGSGGSPLTCSLSLQYFRLEGWGWRCKASALQALGLLGTSQQPHSCQFLGSPSSAQMQLTGNLKPKLR